VLYPRLNLLFLRFPEPALLVPHCIYTFIVHSVLVLSRCGFSQNMRSKRPDYHTVKELLQHEFEVRIRGLWLWVANTTSLTELKDWLEHPNRTPDDIFKAGGRIQRERVSKAAVSLYRCTMEDLPAEESDSVFLNTLMQHRDLSLFWDLAHAVKHGLVGHMEDLLPELLVGMRTMQSRCMSYCSLCIMKFLQRLGMCVYMHS
jgi:hypothetical protein